MPGAFDAISEWTGAAIRGLATEILRSGHRRLRRQLRPIALPSEALHDTSKHPDPSREATQKLPGNKQEGLADVFACSEVGIAFDRGGAGNDLD